MEEKDYLNCLEEIVRDQVVTFTAKGKTYNVYPISLGKKFLINRQLQNIQFDDELGKKIPMLEVMRVCEKHKDTVLRILAYATIKTKDDVLNNIKVKDRIKAFNDALSVRDMASLLTPILNDYTPILIKHFGVEEEDKRKTEVLKVKKDKNTFFFGGKTIYGTLLDFACERYGWTFDYVVWGISYTNLMMLYKDQSTSVYLSDEELKQAHIFGGDVIDGNDAESMRKVIAEQSWK
jgi:hypothetical protein